MKGLNKKQAEEEPTHSSSDVAAIGPRHSGLGQERSKGVVTEIADVRYAHGQVAKVTHHKRRL